MADIGPGEPPTNHADADWGEEEIHIDIENGCCSFGFPQGDRVHARAHKTVEHLMRMLAYHIDMRLADGSPVILKEAPDRRGMSMTEAYNLLYEINGDAYSEQTGTTHGTFVYHVVPGGIKYPPEEPGDSECPLSLLTEDWVDYDLEIKMEGDNAKMTLLDAEGSATVASVTATMDDRMETVLRQLAAAVGLTVAEGEEAVHHEGWCGLDVGDVVDILARSHGWGDEV
jgi:hypothetical protein